MEDVRKGTSLHLRPGAWTTVSDDELKALKSKFVDKFHVAPAPERRAPPPAPAKAPAPARASAPEPPAPKKKPNASGQPG